MGKTKINNSHWIIAGLSWKIRMLLGSKRYLKFKVKTVAAGYCISLNCHWRWWTRWSFSLPEFLHIHARLWDKRTQQDNVLFYWRTGYFQMRRWNHGQKSSSFILYFIKFITTSQRSKRDAIFVLCRERDLKVGGQVSFMEKKKKMIKINPANSLISFSFPARQMFSHYSVSDAVSRLLRWLKKKNHKQTLALILRILKS